MSNSEVRKIKIKAEGSGFKEVNKRDKSEIQLCILNDGLKIEFKFDQHTRTCKYIINQLFVFKRMYRQVLIIINSSNNLKFNIPTNDL